MTPDKLRNRFADFTWIRQSHWPDAVTWRLERGASSVYFLKVTTATRYPRALDECARARWAHDALPAPAVVACGNEDGLDWLLTKALPGVDATHPTWRSRPAELVRLLVRGLRRFHAVPVASCPFGFNLDDALSHVRRRAKAGLINAARDFHPEHAQLSVDAAVAELERLRPESEDTVVCHGDYCLPNILLASGDGSGFVDLGELGVADRWWDLAVATWSVTWNLGGGWEDLFLEAYGIAQDEQRTAFYRLLYDLVS